MKPDPWHVDILIQRLHDALQSMADDYHRDTSARHLYQQLALMHEILDALAVQLPASCEPLRMIPRVKRHQHFSPKEPQHHIMQVKDQ